jgi:hypothetical protein
VNAEDESEIENELFVKLNQLNGPISRSLNVMQYFGLHTVLHLPEYLNLHAHVLSPEAAAHRRDALRARDEMR